MSGSSGDTADAINAIEYAKSMGIKIMNVSWGCPEYNNALKDEMSRADMLFVCAAGNDGSSSTSYPAAFKLPNIVSVGSIDSKGDISKFNDTGSAPDLYAPGENIVTTDPDNGYATVSGTSFAAAYVSGIAALVKEAVPNITTGELKLALINGYLEKGASKIKVADADNTIKAALPLKYINDANGRLSRAMEYAQKIITPEIADILTRYTSWSQLNDARKSTLTAFFSISSDDMAVCSSSDLGLTDSIVALLAAKKAGLDADTVISLLKVYRDASTFDTEMAGASSLFSQLTLSDSEKGSAVDLMKSGYTVAEIASSLIAAKTINDSVTCLIQPRDSTYNFRDTGYSGSENDSLMQLIQKYSLNETCVLNYLKSSREKPSSLQNRLFLWQKTNDFYVVNNTVTAYSVSPAVSSGFNKYKLTKGNVWSSGNASIDKTDGILTYTQPLISLSGRNGLNLNLGLRFDSDISDAVINANGSSLVIP